MSYEIDFIGVKKEECKQDADAICLRWEYGRNQFNAPLYKIGVVDGGFEAHGKAIVDHLNTYYFDDKNNQKAKQIKKVDFVLVTHPDQDHTIGIKQVLENFSVQKLYMNRPWTYADTLYPRVTDGRISVESLKRRLREKYKTIAEIEDIAIENGIPIYEAFQGVEIEDTLLVLSPSKEFYLELLVESSKTPLERNDAMAYAYNFFKAAKDYVLSLLETWNEELLRENVQTTAENESSVVLRGKVDESGFLLTGDAGIRALTCAMDYLDSIGISIQTDISYYQIPHHGGRHNISPAVLNRMIGKKVPEGTTIDKYAMASVADDSDHPLKIVTNAFIRRGVSVFKTMGCTHSHHEGDMPRREGWSSVQSLPFSNHVEQWDE